ncbi:proline-rich proteoglycan 2-like [Dipodomys spectabilis]|uniref:proline-rich proteoglycan 2-like n=1 Tax=Dipodomys spectabilis TaxID=105255 RepID=UPI001C539AFD|nr:proline-rich proteoglycan 2-like [Dipodomys spectabilis]
MLLSVCGQLCGIVVTSTSAELIHSDRDVLVLHRTSVYLVSTLKLTSHSSHEEADTKAEGRKANVGYGKGWIPGAAEPGRPREAGDPGEGRAARVGRPRTPRAGPGERPARTRGPAGAGPEPPGGAAPARGPARAGRPRRRGAAPPRSGGPQAFATHLPTSAGAGSAPPSTAGEEGTPVPRRPSRVARQNTNGRRRPRPQPPAAAPTDSNTVAWRHAANQRRA